MKNKINYEAYYLSIMDILFNGSTYTELNGKYRLEYKLYFDNLYANEDYAGVAALAIAVRLVNKHNGKIEWGNVFYKSLSKDEYIKTSNLASRKKFQYMILMLCGGSKQEKLDFINKSESRIFTKPYQTKSTTSASISEYFENLNGRDVDDGWPTVSLNGHFPKDASEYLTSAYNGILDNTEQKRLTR